MKKTLDVHELLRTLVAAQELRERHGRNMFSANHRMSRHDAINSVLGSNPDPDFAMIAYQMIHCGFDGEWEDFVEETLRPRLLSLTS
jgi:hypothetical protein